MIRRKLRNLKGKNRQSKDTSMTVKDTWTGTTIVKVQEEPVAIPQPLVSTLAKKWGKQKCEEAMEAISGHNPHVKKNACTWRRLKTQQATPETELVGNPTLNRESRIYNISLYPQGPQRGLPSMQLWLAKRRFKVCGNFLPTSRAPPSQAV